METILSTEKQRAAAIADEYRRKGFDVIEEPMPEQLPEFLSGFHPDLLIRKGEKTTIVEVKSRRSLAKDVQIRELARLLHAKPNWNFELIVVGEEEPFGASDSTRPMKRDDVLQGLETAEKLLQSGFSEAALMQAWSISEAAIRLLFEADGITPDRLSPLHTLKQAVTNGIISKDDYEFLTKVMKHRNALAHGYKTMDFDQALVMELIAMTKRLVLQATIVA